MKLSKKIFTTFVGIMLLCLLSPCRLEAKQVIKEVNITFPLPKPGDNIHNTIKITSVTTDLNGGEEMLKKGVIEHKGFIVFYIRNCEGRLTSTGSNTVEEGMEYFMHGSITNYTDTYFNHIFKDGNYQCNNSLVKLTINGKPAKILKGSHTRGITFETTFTVPGTLSPITANTTVSQPDGEVNGFSYVDMGLPSGAKWATCNLGATQPEGYGDFFAFGETKTKPRFDAQSFTGFGSYVNNPGKNFNEEYNIYLDTSKKKRPLNKNKDAASQIMGEEWRTPSRDDCKELFKNSQTKYFVYKGVKGLLITSKINCKSIFIPFSGTKNEYLEWAPQGINGRGYNAQMWTSILDTTVPPNSFWWGGQNDTDDITGYDHFRYDYAGFNESTQHCAVGLTIRAVCGGNPDKLTGKSADKSTGKAKSSSTKTSKKTSKKSDDLGKEVSKEVKKNLKKGVNNLLKKKR